MNELDLAFLPALEQAKLIRTKAISPLELTQIYLKRIDRLNDRLGSYFSVATERAIADAKAKTEQLAQTADLAQLPPFFGVPISIKDLTAVKDLPWSRGVAALQNEIAGHDTQVVARLKQAGFVILGKTATSQVGSFPYTEPPGFPPARNPWNLDYTPGGSSGGAAAALAAGLCPISQGSDGGGSVRGPAACCGVVGLKPSRGRVSSAPVGEQFVGLATNGPIARTVADAAAMLDLMSGYVTGDPYWLPDPERSFLDATRQPVGSLRIGFATEFPGLGKATPPLEDAVMRTLQHLEDLGHVVEPRTLDVRNITAAFTAIWQTNVATLGIPPEILSPMNRWNAENCVDIGGFVQAKTQLQILSRQIVAQFAGLDVLVTPTYLHPTIKVGEWADLPPEATLQKIIDWIVPCPPFNATGQPAISLPAGFDENGLPIGVQLVGQPADEATLLAVAAQLETAGLWGDRRPEIAELV
ncbi:MAG: amidase [Cyanobacteriota bacterium]|nr:amidase [Cyanobacteriota bacterium]